MGNKLGSCAHPFRTVRLVQFDSGFERVVRIKEPTKVAEVMLDNPNHFICSFRSVQAGHRVVALPAEEELESGNIYLILPMTKLRCVISASDMARIQACLQQPNNNSWPNKKKQASFDSRVLPVSGENYAKDSVENEALPRLKVDEIAQKELEKLKMGGCRYWKPRLLTIQESLSLRG